MHITFIGFMYFKVVLVVVVVIMIMMSSSSRVNICGWGRHWSNFMDAQVDLHFHSIHITLWVCCALAKSESLKINKY